MSFISRRASLLNSVRNHGRSGRDTNHKDRLGLCHSPLTDFWLHSPQGRASCVDSEVWVWVFLMHNFNPFLGWLKFEDYPPVVMLGYIPIDCDTSGVDACATGKRIQTAARRGPKVHAIYARQGPTVAHCFAYLFIVIVEAHYAFVLERCMRSSSPIWVSRNSKLSRMEIMYRSHLLISNRRQR